jgi:uncharacterized RDD family membrane protein YckC
MDAAVVEAKQEEAALAVFRAVSRSAEAPWVRVRVFWSEIAGNVSTFLDIWDEQDEQDERSSVRVPREVHEPLRELRRQTERPGEGAWLSTFLTVTADGRYAYEYNYDRRPSWTNSDDPLSGHADDPPTDESLVADLEQHPRRPESLPAWYPVARPAAGQGPVEAGPERVPARLPPPSSVADLVTMPGWAEVWESVVVHLDRVLSPDVARGLAAKPEAERVREIDDVVGDAWRAVWADRVTSLDASGVVGLWEPWARATGRDLALGASVDPRSDVDAHLGAGSPLDLVLQDLGDVVDTLTLAALDARLDDVDGDVDERGLVLGLAERGRMRVVEQPGAELAVGNGDTGFQVAASELGFEVRSTERGRARVRATASTLDLAYRVLLWELRVPVRAVLGLERIAVGHDLASISAGVDVEADVRAVTLSWRSAVGTGRVVFPGSDARRSAVGFAQVLGLGAGAVVDLVLDPDAPRTVGGASSAPSASGPMPPLPHGGWGEPPRDEAASSTTGPSGGAAPSRTDADARVVAVVPLVQLAPDERWAGLVVAGVGRRIGAFAIDVVLSVAVLYGALFAAVALVPDPEVQTWAVPTAFASAELAWLAGLAVAVGLIGRTPGMALLGLRVVHDTDPRRTVGFGRAVLRGLVVFPLGLAWIWLLLLLLSATSFDPSGRRRGWHDRVARSQVVDVRRGADPVADPSWRPPADRRVLVRLA